MMTLNPNNASNFYKLVHSRNSFTSLKKMVCILVIFKLKIFFKSSKYIISTFVFPKIDLNGGKKKFGLFNVKYPQMFQKHSASATEAALASMETLEDKLDTPNDGMENVKLDVTVSIVSILYIIPSILFSTL